MSADGPNRFESKPKELGWHVVSGEHLLNLLRRVELGEKADLVYAEFYANAERDKKEDDVD